jgi:hypothetical protein
VLRSTDEEDDGSGLEDSYANILTVSKKALPCRLRPRRLTAAGECPSACASPGSRSRPQVMTGPAVEAASQCVQRGQHAKGRSVCPRWVLDIGVDRYMAAQVVARLREGPSAAWLPRAERLTGMPAKVYEQTASGAETLIYCSGAGRLYPSNEQRIERITAR